MSYSHFICRFPNQSEFYFNLLHPQEPENIPDWSCFNYFSCPGNISHGSKTEYCQLACHLHRLVNHFSTIKSYEQGTIHVIELDLDNHSKELIIHKDAQNIFFYAVWLILIRSPCSVFRYHQKLREHYALTNDVKKIFYTLFSIFLVDAHFNPEGTSHIDEFKKQLQLFCEVLHNLLERMRQHLNQGADAAHNGLVLLATLVQQVESEMDTFYNDLELSISYGRYHLRYRKDEE